jgi:hypothetical protein
MVTGLLLDRGERNINIYSEGYEAMMESQINQLGFNIHGGKFCKAYIVRTAG